jgi:hypothetical protein
MRDIHSTLRVIRCISPVAVGTTGTGKTGKPVDRSGYDAVELEFSYGTITATNATLTATVFEGDATGAMTSVADADLVGTEVLAGVAAAATRTSGTSKNVTKRIGYTGLKKYVNAKVVSTVTAAPPVGVNVILGMPKIAATPNP